VKGGDLGPNFKRASRSAMFLAVENKKVEALQNGVKQRETPAKSPYPKPSGKIGLAFSSHLSNGWRDQKVK